MSRSLKTKLKQKELQLDAVIIGAGFSGLYQLHCLRNELNLSAAILEAGNGIGGTWYWNRYPGARCDSESHTYCYYFSRELLNEWRWSERYPKQSEILEYLNFCAKKFDLERSIYLNQRVKQAIWNEISLRWEIRTATGFRLEAKFLITAVGCLSSANHPKISGVSNFAGDILHTGEWPQEKVDFSGKSVVVIGTGSTGIQIIPNIAKDASKLTVLQRTANFSVPARNAPLEKGFHKKFRTDIDSWHRKMLDSRHGHPWNAETRKLCETSYEERNEILETAWRNGGLRFKDSFEDILLDESSNQIMSDFIRLKIKDILNDNVKAKILSPFDHGFGTKRPPIDTNYFETYNRENVELFDVGINNICNFESDGIKLSDGTKVPADVVVFATGFDAMTGSLLKMNIVGRKTFNLNNEWQEGPKTYLGLGVHGFPNMFTITGPGSPSVLTNMPRAIEQHVDWISSLLSYAKANNVNEIEAEREAMLEWTEHVSVSAKSTLLPKGKNSWYFGANISGKPSVFMPYAGGLNTYRTYCENVASNGYKGFRMKYDT